MKLPTALLSTLLAAAGALPAATAPLQEQKPATWPELSGREKKQVELEIQKLRKARTEEMAESAQDALLEVSPGAVPLLLKAFAKEQDAVALARLDAAMRHLTGAEHTRALAADFDHKEPRVRTWCLRRAAAFPDGDLREPALAALAAVRKAGERAADDERYAAALCATSTGSTEGFDLLRPVVAEDWAERGAELRAALEAARGPEAGALLVAELASPERERRLVALRMLSGAGDESTVQAIARALDDDDNQLRVAAINALRGIVDGDGPLENLPVFRAIELARTWKQRVGR